MIYITAMRVQYLQKKNRKSALPHGGCINIFFKISKRLINKVINTGAQLYD